MLSSLLQLLWHRNTSLHKTSSKTRIRHKPRQATVELLESWLSGAADEQELTGEELVRALDEDRLSDRSLFPSELRGVTW